MQHFAQIADQRHIHLDVLVDFGGIDLDVDLLGILGVGLEIAGDAVVEAHAQGQQQVGFLNGVVDPGFAVHSHHAQVQRMRSGKRAQAEQSQSHGNAGLLRQGQNFRHGARDDDAVPRENQRPLGIVDQLQGLRVLAFPRAKGRDDSRATAACAASQSNSQEDCCASLVMSTSTGPGRPERAT